LGGVGFHVLESVLVGADDVEFEALNCDDGSDKEIFSLEWLLGHRIGTLALLGELALTLAGVADLQLEYGAVVVSRIERQDKSAVLVLLLGVVHDSFVAADHIGVGHKLDHILTRGLGVECVDRAEGVLLGTETGLGGRGQGGLVDAGLVEFEVALGGTSVGVPVAGGVIARVDEEGTTTDGYEITDHKIIIGDRDQTGRVDHARDTGGDHVLVQRTTLGEHGELSATAIAGVGFQNLNTVVSQEVMEGEVGADAVTRVVIPVAIEPQDFAVILQELLQKAVGVHGVVHGGAVHLVVHHGFGKRLGVVLLLELLSGVPIILGNVALLTDINSFGFEVVLGPLVHADNLVLALVDADSAAHLHVLGLEASAVILGDDVALDAALTKTGNRETRVRDLGFCDLNSAILKVETDGAGADAVDLGGLLQGLLGEGMHAKDLTVMLQPGRLSLGLVCVASSLLRRVALVMSWVGDCGVETPGWISLHFCHHSLIHLRVCLGLIHGHAVEGILEDVRLVVGLFEIALQGIARQIGNFDVFPSHREILVFLLLLLLLLLFFVLRGVCNFCRLPFFLLRGQLIICKNMK